MEIKQYTTGKPRSLQSASQQDANVRLSFHPIATEFPFLVLFPRVIEYIMTESRTSMQLRNYKTYQQYVARRTKFFSNGDMPNLEVFCYTKTLSSK